MSQGGDGQQRLQASCHFFRLELHHRYCNGEVYVLDGVKQQEYQWYTHVSVKSEACQDDLGTGAKVQQNEEEDNYVLMEES